jgi:hypothetical protein
MGLNFGDMVLNQPNLIKAKGRIFPHCLGQALCFQMGIMSFKVRSMENIKFLHLPNRCSKYDFSTHLAAWPHLGQPLILEAPPRLEWY